MIKKQNDQFRFSSAIILLAGLLVVLGVMWVLLFRQSHPLHSQPQSAAAYQITGTYRTHLAAADSPGRVITLKLNEDGSATFIQDFLNDQPAFLEEGTWVKQENNRVQVALKQPLSFRYFAENTQLLRLVNHDETMWGSEGLTLQRLDLLLASSWLWQKTTLSDGSVIMPSRPQAFGLRFYENGAVDVSTDCNNGRGTYEVRGASGLTMGPIMRTFMFCPNSREDEFYQELAQVASYEIQDGVLRLLFKSNTGVMTFKAQESETQFSRMGYPTVSGCMSDTGIQGRNYLMATAQ